MKNLYIIGGPMGIGKTTVCLILKKQLPHAVFLDGDWSWDADPFTVTEETRSMVKENICYLLNQFLACSAYENIIFCWVLHEQEILDSILSRLDLENVRVFCGTLLCSEKTLQGRLEKDVQAGLRSPDIYERSLDRLESCRRLKTVPVWTDGLDPQETAEKIRLLASRQEKAEEINS